MNSIRPRKFDLWYFWALLVCLLSTPAVTRGQTETLRRYRGDDIEIQVDQNWTPVNSGGYFPVIMTIKNRGPDASIRVYSKDDTPAAYAGGAFAPTVEKRFELAQNATTRMTFLLPVVSMNSNTEIRVSKNGREIESLSIPVSFSQGLGNATFLVIDKNLPNTSVFDIYYQRVLAASVSTSLSGNIVLRMPESMPDTWLAYSGIDVVFADARSLTVDMDDSRRSELLRWVSTGGSLVIYNVGKMNKKMDSLARSIEASGWSSKLSGWKKIRSKTTRFDDGDGKGERDFFVELRSSDFLFGKLIAMDDDPFKFTRIPDRYYQKKGIAIPPQARRPGQPTTRRHTESDLHPGWSHLFGALGTDSSNWSRRHGFMPRFYSKDFLMFLNPGIRKIPTWGFITLITLFAIIIGPLNYWILRRKNRVSQLLWTTPAIALVTSLILFGWSSLANGTSSHVRLRSLSILDQNSQTLVSKTRMAIFAGIAPRDGLRFEPFSAVYPIWQEENAFESGVVDWTNAQVVTGSFIRSNTRSQFFVTTPRTERGRLQIGEKTGSGLTVTNGLEWDIELLLLRDSSGDYYFGRHLDAGKSSILRPVEDADIESIQDRISRQKLVLPNVPPPTNLSRSSRYTRYGGVATPAISARFATGRVEKTFTRLTRDLTTKDAVLPSGEKLDDGLPASSFLAVLSEQPDLDIGLQKYKTSDELHVLLGNF